MIDLAIYIAFGLAALVAVGSITWSVVLGLERWVETRRELDEIDRVDLAGDFVIRDADEADAVVFSVGPETPCEGCHRPTTFKWHGRWCSRCWEEVDAD